MTILVLGGTRFVGRTFAEAALKRGHHLTLFNRGQSAPDLFKEVDQIHGDRAEDVSSLVGRTWDAVFDTCGYFPRVVRMSAEALKDQVKRYLFISSVSVYRYASESNLKEDSELAKATETFPEVVDEKTYGPLKVQCEQVVQEVFGAKATIVRPGLIVGPHDTTDRFTYWPARMSKGGTVLVPDRKQQPVQFIDVRDLAEWCVDLLEKNTSGTFNATGAMEPYILGEVLAACAKGTEAKLQWVSTDFLNEQNVEPWSDLPLYLPANGNMDGLCEVDTRRALRTGLSFRPLTETIEDTRRWALSNSHTPKAGLSPEREAELLALWQSRS